MLHRVLVGDNERVLVIRKKRFAEILAPGEHWIFGLDVQLERHNIRGLVFASEWADTIVNTRAAMAAEFFTVVETLDAQVAVVYLDGKLARLVMPGQRVLYWKGAVNVTFDPIDVRRDPEVPERLRAPLARLGRESGVTFAVVDEGKRGLVYIDGRLVRELEAGTYGFWNVVSAP